MAELAFAPRKKENETGKNRCRSEFRRGHANPLFSGRLNYYVYQKTPYDLEKLRE